MNRMTLKRAAWLLAIPVCAFTTGLAAQDKPDFSGQWTSEQAQAENPQLGGRIGGTRGTGGQRGGTRRQQGRGQRGGRQRSGDMGSGWHANIGITQDADALSLRYSFFGRGDMQPALRFTYALDGSVSKNSVEMGRGVQVQSSTTAWHGDKLVITTVHEFPHPATGKSIPYEVQHSLSLESTTSLIVETTRSGVLGGKASTTRTVYRRQ